MKTDFNTAIRNASWVLCPAEFEAPVIRRHFNISSAASAEIAVSALGFFKLYVNGNVVGDEYFRPSNSVFHARDSKSWIYPISDTFTYRCYYSVMDITPLLCKGENTIEIVLGNGWYRQTERTAEGSGACDGGICAGGCRGGKR